MKDKSNAKTFVNSDGVEIYYWTTWRKDMKKGFKILHPGAAMNHSSLERLEQGLNEQGHPTVVFDPRGSGYSDHPIKRESYRLDCITGDLEGVIRQEGIESPSLVAHSFGFMPAVDYAVRTGNVRDITGICGSHKFSDTAPNKFLFHLFDKILIHSEYLGSVGTLLAHKVKGDKRGYCDQSNPTSEFALWLKIVDIPLRSAASHVIGQRECNTWDITSQLQQLQTPLLLIYGANDQMVCPIAGEYIKKRTSAPCNVEIIPDATHSLPIRTPQIVLEIMNKYVQ